jgi:hypothetical protein
VVSATLNLSKKTRDFMSDANVGSAAGAGLTCAGTGTLTVNNADVPEVLCTGVTNILVLTYKDAFGVATKMTIGKAAAPPIFVSGVVFTDWRLQGSNNDTEGPAFSYDLDFTLVFAGDDTSISTLIVNATA